MLVVARPDNLGDMLQVDLVADSGSGRHHLEIVERLAAPFEELVAFAVALIFELDVPLEGAWVPELVDHDAVVDDQVHRHERVDLLGIAAELAHRVAHGGEVDDSGNAGEVLHQHTGRTVLDLAVDPPLLQPVRHRLKVVPGDRLAVLEAEQVLEQHLHREGQARDVAECCASLAERIISVGFAFDFESRTRAEAVLAGGDHRCPSSASKCALEYARKMGAAEPLATRP
jgi:hypothetical protein